MQLLTLSNFGRLATRHQDDPLGKWQEWDTTFPDHEASSSVVGRDNQNGTLQIIVSLSGIPALVTETRSGFGTTGIPNVDRDPFSIARNTDGRLEASMIIGGDLVNIRQHAPNQIPSRGEAAGNVMICIDLPHKSMWETHAWSAPGMAASPYSSKAATVSSGCADRQHPTVSGTTGTAWGRADKRARGLSFLGCRPKPGRPP